MKSPNKQKSNDTSSAPESGTKDSGRDVDIHATERRDQAASARGPGGKGNRAKGNAGKKDDPSSAVEES